MKITAIFLNGKKHKLNIEEKINFIKEKMKNKKESVKNYENFIKHVHDEKCELIQMNLGDK